MNRKLLIPVTLIAAFVAVIAACNKTPNAGGAGHNPKLPATPFHYTDITLDGQPMKLQEIIADDSRKTINDNSVALGRVLFYDKLLSINNTVACASCHKQEFAFSDQMALSDGFANKKTLRNSMGIQNVVTNAHMFWDSRSESPYDLSLKPVFNHIEMGIENDEMLVQKISGATYYPSLFDKAYGSKGITKDRIAMAISHFLHATFSQNSKFDKEQVNSFKGYTAMEKMGKDLFFSAEMKCNQCHAGSNFAAPDGNFMAFFGKPGFVDPSFNGGGGGYGGPVVRGTANIGLDKQTTDAGNNGAFKIPSLRNIALTGPYMHDGRFAKLEDVLNHYSHGIKAHPGLDDKFKDASGRPKGLNLSSIETDALVAFLNTLTDQNLITNPKFADPFKP